MPVKKTAKPTDDTLEIQKIERPFARYWLLGSSPIILNRLAEKARHELLLPRGRTNAAERASRLKHDPVAEFQASPYRLSNADAPTLLAIMGSAVKGAMSSAALRLPGATKSEVGQLVTVPAEYLPIWGVPRLHMSIVRSADAARTPDVRTRTIVAQWATAVDITYVTPLINLRGITNLLTAAGVIAGVGDWRPEKGKGAFGQFEVVNEDDPRLLEVMSHGRAEQEYAMSSPEAYDDETAELLTWFEEEIKARGQQKLLQAMADFTTMNEVGNGKVKVEA